MESGDFLKEVKAQYEDLPYPPRNPADEKHRLLHTVGDKLVGMNHYCFNGRRDFRKGFRALVAGGGTGDGLIFLAEQLRDFGGEVVYLDMSEASRAIAQERAKVRGLTNIEWVTDSIMSLPRLELGEFDYINCCGVLHHLESTEDGLEALTSVLKQDGAIFLMLYAKYGRQGVYDMQALLKNYLPVGLGHDEKIAATRELLTDLPVSNHFRQEGKRWESEIAARSLGDSGLYDLLLHSQDRCFDVPQIYQLAESAGLNIAGFSANADKYNPLMWATKPSIRKYLSGLPVYDQQVISEQLSCSIIKHEFYLSRNSDTVANLADQDNTLLLFNELFQRQGEIAAAIIPGKNCSFNIDGRNISFPGTAISKVIVECMDGKTTLKKIYKKVKKAVPGVRNSEIRNELDELCEILVSKGFLYIMKDGSYGIKLPDYSAYV
jgi:ubiquinone/menaquinone biosynthesis C-methylase UbiE